MRTENVVVTLANGGAVAIPREGSSEVYPTQQAAIDAVSQDVGHPLKVYGVDGRLVHDIAKLRGRRRAA